MKPFITIFILLGIFFSSYGQEPNTPVHSFHLKVGIGHGQIKDKAASRLIYRGINAPIGLDYQYAWKKHQLKMGIAGYFSKPKSRFKDRALWINYACHLGYRQLIQSNEKWKLSIGADLPFQTTVDFFEDIQAEYFYWISTVSINPGFRFERHLKDQKNWFVEGDFPLLGIYSRPPLQRFTNAAGDFGFILSETNTQYQFFIPLQHFQFQLQGGYQYALNKKIEQRLSYQLVFLRNPNPEPISLIIHQINLHTRFKRNKKS